VRTKRTLEQLVEAPEVTTESVDQRVPDLFGEVVPERKRSRGSAVTEGISDISVIGVVPSDSVGNRVGKVEVLGESTSGDLEIIIRVTPSTHSARGGRVEDRGIGELRARVCRQKRYQHNWIPATGGER